MDPHAALAALAFMAGTWRTDWFEATYTSPEGGLMLSVNKEFRDGKVVFFEFERFAVRDGKLMMTPFLAGKEASVSFPLHEIDVAKQRAHFRNAAHDFPQDLVYQRVAPDRLLIVLTGVEAGKPRELRFDLRRQP